MKLPEDKKERTKILVLIAIGVVVVLYLAIIGVVNPALRKKNERTVRVQELRDDLKKARREISRMPRDRKQNDKTVAKIREVADKYVLRSRLGNFLLGGRETIERHAKNVDVELETVREIGIAEIPQSGKKKSGNAFKSYTIRVAVNCGFHDLLRLLRQLEKSNPYLCVSSVGITERSGTPAKHTVSFDVQWPIWADNEMASKLEQQLNSTD